MSGLTPTSPRPTDIKLHQKSRELEVVFDDGKTFRFSCEFLRVYSPSAEVRGHGPGQEVLQVGKKSVEITAIEPTGSKIALSQFEAPLVIGYGASRHMGHANSSDIDFADPVKSLFDATGLIVPVTEIAGMKYIAPDNIYMNSFCRKIGEIDNTKIH